MLQLMVDFMELFLPVVQADNKQEPLWVTMKNTLQTVIHDSNLNKEKNGSVLINLIYRGYLLF